MCAKIQAACGAVILPRITRAPIVNNTRPHISGVLVAILDRLRYAVSSLTAAACAKVAYSIDAARRHSEGVRGSHSKSQKVLPSEARFAACPKSHLMAKTLFIGDGIGARMQ